jgi:branched-subunit amino acid aminotransferase/4-amino-4-deoxychorismate lyase
MLLINGCEQTSLAANDRATQFGDGCFTTARIDNGTISLLAEHLHRLKLACDRLFIPFSQWETLEDEMRRCRGKDEWGSEGNHQPWRRWTWLQRSRLPESDAYSQRFRLSDALRTLEGRGHYAVTQPGTLGRNPHLAGSNI